MGKKIGCSCCYSTGDYNYKDFRRGNAFDGWEETPHKKKAKKKPRKKDRCPENNNKAHIYIWTYRTSVHIERFFRNKYGFWPTEEKVCCGCLKKQPGWSSTRKTEEYKEWRKTHKSSFWTYVDFQ